MPPSPVVTHHSLPDAGSRNVERVTREPGMGDILPQGRSAVGLVAPPSVAS